MALVCPAIRLIYVPAPHTASKAVIAALSPWAVREQNGDISVWGKTWVGIRHYAEPFLRDGWKLVAVLRNPWDRAAAFYETTGWGHDTSTWLARYAFQDGMLPMMLHAGPDATLLSFETLAADFAVLADQHGFDNRLGEIRPSARDPLSVFTEADLWTIKSSMRSDVKAGGYTMPTRVGHP